MRQWKTLMSILLIIVSTSSFSSPKSKSIKKAKELYEIHPFTFFCEKPIDVDGTTLTRHCDLCPSFPINVTWMNIIPTKRLAKDRVCYSHKVCRNKKGEPSKGIMCCREIDDDFVEMESDLHNIAPEDPSLSRLNLSNTIALVDKRKGQFVCDFRFDHSAKQIQPPPQSRGTLARTYLYFESTYGLVLSDDEKNLFIQWHYAYPADAWEKERSAQIYAQTGKLNAWVH
jgi:deoxyribonuclease I